MRRSHGDGGIPEQPRSLHGSASLTMRPRCRRRACGAPRRNAHPLRLHHCLRIASDQSNTFPMRDRIASGEMRGPRILTAGLALYPPDAIPFYLRDQPKEFLAQPVPATQRGRSARGCTPELAAGTDATKLFMVTSADRPQRLRVDGGGSRACRRAKRRTIAANSCSRIPTSLAGIRAALDAGVDILVHTTLGEEVALGRGHWSREMVAKHMAVIPTLQALALRAAQGGVPQKSSKNWSAPRSRNWAPFGGGRTGPLRHRRGLHARVRSHATNTVYMAQAGMTPCRSWRRSPRRLPPAGKKIDRRGRVAPGFDADLVVLAADPADDVKNFAKVRCAFAAGTTIYASTAVN